MGYCEFKLCVIELQISVLLDQGERRRNELTTMLILLEEILRNHQINMLLISFIITLIRPEIRKRKR